MDSAATAKRLGQPGACRQITAKEYAVQGESYTQQQLALLAKHVKEMEDDSHDGTSGLLTSTNSDVEQPSSHFQIVRHLNDLRQAWKLRRAGRLDETTGENLLTVVS
jgi:hypothetical protein